MPAVPMIEMWRGDLAEEVHLGHAVICRPGGDIVEAWGDPSAPIYPRSSCKIIQALPLVESGAADAAGLDARHLALACASHNGAHIHTELAGAWLAAIGREEPDLRCGAQVPGDAQARDELVRQGAAPCQLHNNCSGKHAGFLTLSRHLGAGPEYVDIAHPVQAAVRAAFEETTGEAADRWGIDGCSAPNFVVTLRGLARAMADLAAAGRGAGLRDRASRRLVEAMLAHPELVAGEGRACTALMRAMGGKGIVKVGGSDVYVAILPEQSLGIAIKIIDGSLAAVQASVATLLVKVGALDPENPVVGRYLTGPLVNWRGIETGRRRLAPGFA